MFGPLSVGAIVGILVAGCLFVLTHGAFDFDYQSGSNASGIIAWAVVGAPIGGAVGALIEQKNRK